LTCRFCLGSIHRQLSVQCLSLALLKSATDIATFRLGITHDKANKSEKQKNDVTRSASRAVTTWSTVYITAQKILIVSSTLSLFWKK
jgi:hypothetical protein